MKPLHGQIVSLLKSIHLRAPEPGRRAQMQFAAGKRSPGFLSGLYLSWWRGEGAKYAVDSTTLLLLKSDKALAGCDFSTAKGVVWDTLQERCIDASLFDGDDVVFARKATLFDCLVTSVPDAAQRLCAAMQDGVRALLGRRCLVHVVPRLKCESFAVPEVEIHVVARDDAVAWSRVNADGFSCGGWTPNNPILNGRQDNVFAPHTAFDTVLVASNVGTLNSIRQESTLRLQTLLAVIFAVASDRAPYPYLKSGGTPSTFGVLFPHSSCQDRSCQKSGVPVIFPYYISDVALDAEGIATVKTWYANLWAQQPDRRTRAERSAHFLNLGMNSKGTESFVNCYIALDALLGQRGSVEASILAGLAKLQLDPKQVEKAKWLFELRNELVHGGSRFVEEWPRYPAYVRHFDGDPMIDVLKIAQTALLRAPSML